MWTQTRIAALGAALLAGAAVGVLASSDAMAVTGGNANETGGNTGVTGSATPGNDANSPRGGRTSGTAMTPGGKATGNTAAGGANAKNRHHRGTDQGKAR